MWQCLNLIPLLLEITKPVDLEKRQRFIALRGQVMLQINNAELQHQLMDLLDELLKHAELRTEFGTSISMVALKGEFSDLPSEIDK